MTHELLLILAQLATSDPAAGETVKPMPQPDSSIPGLVGDLSQEKEPAFLKAGSFPGAILVPGSDVSIKFGGRIKVDAIKDFDAIGTTDEFKTSAIPVPEVGSNGNTDFHAQDTRLSLEARSPSTLGELRGYVEGNFWGSDFTLRHAYIQTPNLLVGQTWTNFMMIESRPDTLDYEGPDGSVFLRQTQVRWTQALGKTNHWSVALEDPASNVSGPVGSTPEQPNPDLTAGIRTDFERGHNYVAGLIREVGYTGAGSDDVLGWGLQVSGEVKTVGKDNFRYQVAYGQGIARYIEDLRGSNLDAALDSSGDLEALDTYGGFLSYQHYWNETLRSSAVYSVTGVDLTNAQAANTLENTSYLAANVIWTAAKRFDVGFEYLFGTRENNDGSDANANRVQLSFIYSL
jgi:hypothetical protein